MSIMVSILEMALVRTMGSIGASTSLAGAFEILLGKRPENKIESDLSQSIEVVEKQLSTSKYAIDAVLSELEKQKENVDNLKKQAELYGRMSSLSEEQKQAITTFLTQHEKKSAKANWYWNLFFCCLSAVIGWLLGRFLPF